MPCRRNSPRLKSELTTRTAQWQNEKKNVDTLSKLREQIEDIHKQIEKAQREYNLEKAAELQYGELPKLEQQLAIEERKSP